MNTFKFNFLYIHAKVGTSDLGLKRRIIYLMPELLFLCSAIIKIHRKDFFYGISGIVGTITLTYMLISGAEFEHYFMLGVPLIPIAIMVIINDMHIKGVKMLYVVSLLSAIIIVVYGLHNFPRVIELTLGHNMKNEYAQYNNKLIEVFEKIPEQDWHNTAEYNLQGFQKTIFLVTELEPIPKHAISTERHASYDANVMDKTIAWYKDNNPKYIIMPGSSQESRMLEYINDNYELIYSAIINSELLGNDEIRLYRIK